jgi:NADH-quinone oxidoreductase subunit L
MEGPTPVSALIHAATMVTAGVFLVCRMSPLFELAPTASMVVTYVGALTAIFAATIGMTQFDIKRVIAYSTMSQLGYMFFAAGVGAYGAAMFHLMTHAFFKALLFLGAGSVIHAMSNEQDMRKMGGIWKLIPVTYALMWIGSLALAGIPFFAGYYSKDMILESAFAAHTQAGQFAFMMGILAAALTAFYSWRLILMTFHGQPRADHETMHHVHESPLIMLVPLFVLAAGALFAGYVFYPYFVGHEHIEFWGASIFIREGHDVLEAAHHVPEWVPLSPLVVAISGIVLAYICYLWATGIPATVARIFKPIHLLFFNKWYVDELYDAMFVKPAWALGRGFFQIGDQAIINGMGPDGLAKISRQGARALSIMQSGYVYHYAFTMIVAIVLLMGWLLFKLMGGL